MALVPYEPFRHLNHMRREMDQFFNRDFPFWSNDWPQSFGHLSIDVHETDREVIATCNIPGLEKKEDVDIDIERQMLKISGTLNRTHEVKEEQMHRQERFHGRFQRSISLPAPVSSEGVTASYKNGVLEIRMPKANGDSRRKIDVQFH
ncbi:Hsp20/alpha crystallin family protein [Cohnella zeiphila]|uniref:Hsp20/alpha crystallin family protein n=1 Tax=Cohnella zeiphila TaxID=2761120 RepID=A0A7X0SXE6_9BACL|nr:Hsp20/alpha crystallin family protein [Cohnella zeiphila]MBB6735678.1 Hsp20/alpha crystallin family protein [Cohnella zeiphila]